MVERTVTHEVVFTNRGSVSVSDVAASLIANEQLVRSAVETLADLFPGLETSVNVRFQTATTASPLKEYFVLGLALLYQENITSDIPHGIERMLNIDIPDGLEAPVGILLMATALYGISAAFEAFKTKKTGEPVPVSISGNYNTIILAAGETLGVEPQAVRAAIEKAHRGPKTRALARRALEFIRPAKCENGAGILSGGVEITPEAIAAAPSSADVAAEDEDYQEPILSQTVVVHATDLDSKKTGWAGHLPGRWEKRIKMQLFPTVEAAEIYGKTEIIADIILLLRPDDGGEMVPYLVIITKVHP